MQGITRVSQTQHSKSRKELCPARIIRGNHEGGEGAYQESLAASFWPPTWIPHQPFCLLAQHNISNMAGSWIRMHWKRPPSCNLTEANALQCILEKPFIEAFAANRIQAICQDALHCNSRNYLSSCKASGCENSSCRPDLLGLTLCFLPQLFQVTVDNFGQPCFCCCVHDFASPFVSLCCHPVG